MMIQCAGVTSLLISEFAGDEKTPIEWFVASGIIQLEHIRSGDAMERTIQVTKMQGIKHSEQIHPLALGTDGIYIQHPRLMP
jgi:KaiC/GvpD/RAD55 family RecA-like ATPase